MDKRPIAFTDSGVGGLPYLELAMRHLPRESFVFAGDRAEYPYGIKTPEQVVRAATALVERLVARCDPKIVIVACNTMSVYALAALRARFPELPFIGVVPAVKPAAVRSRNKRVAVVATDRATRSDYLTGLIRDFADGCEVLRVPATELTDLVELRLFAASDAERAAVLRPIAETILGFGADTVVLACTHYLHVEPELAALLGPDITIVESREGVVNQLERVLKARGLEADGDAATGSFFLTGPDPVEDRYFEFARRYGLGPPELLG